MTQPVRKIVRLSSKLQLIRPLQLQAAPPTISNGPDVDKNYLHDQMAPAASWYVNHNLGKYPSVTVLDSAKTEVEGAVEHLSINSLVVSFTNAFAGSATCN